MVSENLIQNNRVYYNIFQIIKSNKIYNDEFE